MIAGAEPIAYSFLGKSPEVAIDPSHRTEREDFPGSGSSEEPPVRFRIGCEYSFVITLNLHLSTEDVPPSQRFNCQSLPSAGIALLQRYYELIRLPGMSFAVSAVYRPDNRILLIFVGEQTGAPEFPYSQYDTMLQIRISGLITNTFRCGCSISSPWLHNSLLPVLWCWVRY